jgi:hypothetical protein
MNRTLQCGLLGLTLGVTALPFSLLAQVPANYAGIPDGFDYPADKAQLENFRQTQNVSALRRHSWMLFAGMTQLTTDGTPVWETWYRKGEAFRAEGPTPQGPRRMIREFSIPRQFQSQGLTVQAPGESMLSFVLFNKETYDHIRTNKLYQSATLQQINTSFAGPTPWDKRKIQDFPSRAMSLKTIWWPVKGDGLTPLPVWDGDPVNPNPGGTNPFRTWKRVVAVDGTRSHVPDGETTSISFSGKNHVGARVVGFDRFYSIAATPQIIDAINTSETGIQATQQALSRPLKIGDRVVFLGFHVTSKEIDDWTWSSLWWHDRPDEGPFASDRPSQLMGVWRNYLMTVADDQITPPEPNGSPHIGFNPWLEARFADGIVSNCMSCHHRASIPNPGAVDFLPITRGAPNPVTDPAFARGRLQTDFMWSIALENQ